MFPAGQYFMPDRLPRVEIDQRLIIGNDLAAGDRALDLALELNALLQSFIHGGVEEAVHTPAFRLGAVHRHVGLPHRCLDRASIAPAQAAGIALAIVNRAADTHPDFNRERSQRYRLR